MFKFLQDAVDNMSSFKALEIGRWKDYTGADAQELVITFSPKPGILRLQQLGDDMQIGELFPNGTQAKAKVRPGSYVLGLHGRTEQPKQKFAFAITAPPQSVFPDPGFKSDSDGRVHVPFGPFDV
jgi:hypothetical protein